MVATVEGEAFARLYPKEYYSRFVAQDVRPDGRGLEQERPLSITKNVVSTANCSAMVRAGRSTAVAGIKLEVSHPDPETPEEGFFNVQVRFWWDVMLKSNRSALMWHAQSSL